MQVYTQYAYDAISTEGLPGYQLLYALWGVTAEAAAAIPCSTNSGPVVPNCNPNGGLNSIVPVTEQTVSVDQVCAAVPVGPPALWSHWSETRGRQPRRQGLGARGSHRYRVPRLHMAASSLHGHLRCGRPDHPSQRRAVCYLQPLRGP